LRSKIREYLVARIIDGSYAPGDAIRELDVAAQLGVSQGPVREALRELGASGLVEYIPNRGTRVRKIERSDLEQFHAVRALLEAFAGRVAACDLAGRSEPLYALIDEMHEAAKKPDVLGFARASAEFHRYIVAAAGSSPLLDAWNALAIEVVTAVSVAIAPLSLSELAEEHRPITAALDAGDGARAEALLREHVGDYGLPATC
jgi:DNA-binding GntR family transcriptional regulator